MGEQRAPIADEDDVHRDLPFGELAEACIEDLGTPAEDAEMVRFAVHLAAEHVENVGGPGEWEAFDGEAFYRALPLMKAREKEGVGIALAGFFTWMGALGLVAAEDGVRILEGLGAALPRARILPTLCRRGIEALREGPPSA